MISLLCRGRARPDPARWAPGSLNRFLALALVLALAACSSVPRRYAGAGAEYGPQRERQIFYALTLVKADDAQRSAILASFDATDPKLKSLAEESGMLQKQLRVLGPEQPGYLEAVSPLARRDGEIVAEKIGVQAQFLHVVATTLQPEQWSDWEKFFHSFENRSSAVDAEDSEERFAGGRRGRGGP